MLLVALTLMLRPSPGLAGQDLSWDIRPPSDERGPALLVTVRRQVTHIAIRLTRTGSDGSSEQLVLHPNLRVGRQNVVQLPQRQGRSSWEGTIEVQFRDGGGGQAPISFQSQWASAMKLTENASREDVEARRVTVRADHPARRAEVRVTGAGARVLGETEIDLHGAPPGTPLEIAWEQQIDEEPLVVKLTIHSIYGVTASRTWRPWQVHIPHETVEFDTGRSEIRDDQVHKLESVLGDLRDALSRHGTVIEASLWVAGHTDTVGSRELNQRLSEARARAIARWFRRAGLRVPIYYRGFGQDSLLVKTADNVDEPRNRRAEYIVSADDPYEGRRDIPGRWQQLP